MTWVGQRGVGIIVLAASVLALVFAAWSGYETRQTSQCQLRVNQAMDRLITDVLGSSTAEQSRAALERYLITRRGITDDC